MLFPSDFSRYIHFGIADFPMALLDSFRVPVLKNLLLMVQQSGEVEGLDFPFHCVRRIKTYHTESWTSEYVHVYNDPSVSNPGAVNNGGEC